MTWTDLIGVFLLGLTGTGHCLGMCGAFALAVSAGSKRPVGIVARQAVYHFGKATSYAFIGVVLLLASRWVAAQGALAHFQNLLGWVVGLVMIAMGLAYVFELRLPSKALAWWQGSQVCGALGGLWSKPSLLKSMLIGWVNGLLPCGLSLMALLALVNTGSTIGVVTGAYVFGLATLPGLLALGLLGQQIDVSRRRWLVRLGGVALVLFGTLTVLRGVPVVHTWMHEHLMLGGGERCGTEYCR
ncbi:MAG: sulfite exporter TauE/SafE family protein [Nibricoccus sp.]